ncbi:MAG TPA: DinB family protein [Puia sp.]|nr:DinB family protein [Puia sp.]
MKTFLSLLVSLSFLTVTAQTVQNDALKQQLIKDWERAKAYTQEYLSAMPADHYEFKATDSVRTFGQQMLHLAFANVAMAMVGTGMRDSVLGTYLRPGFEKSSLANSKDSVMNLVNTSYDYMLKAIRGFDFTKLNEVVNQRTPGGDRSETRLVWLMKAFEHQTHTRGQCTIYLRLAGVHPPAEKLF